MSESKYLLTTLAGERGEVQNVIRNSLSRPLTSLLSYAMQSTLLTIEGENSVR